MTARVLAQGDAADVGTPDAPAPPPLSEVSIDPVPIASTPKSEPPVTPVGGTTNGIDRRDIRRPAFRLPKVNLYEATPKIEWRDGDGVVPVGQTTSGRGFAVQMATAAMADGKSYSNVLHTHPQWKDNGVISGRLHLASMPKDATAFYGGVGLLRGAAHSDGVTFVVRLATRGPMGVPLVRPLVRQEVKYGPVVWLNVPIPEDCKGAELDVLLTVEAGNSSAQDWAAWVSPQFR